MLNQLDNSQLSSIVWWRRSTLNGGTRPKNSRLSSDMIDRQSIVPMKINGNSLEPLHFQPSPLQPSRFTLKKTHVVTTPRTSKVPQKEQVCATYRMRWWSEAIIFFLWILLVDELMYRGLANDPNQLTCWLFCCYRQTKFQTSNWLNAHRSEFTECKQWWRTNGRNGPQTRLPAQAKPLKEFTNNRSNM